MNDFIKVVNPGEVEVYSGRHAELFVKIEFWDGCLSVTGVVGPGIFMGNFGERSGICAGSCGQCDEELLKIRCYHRGWSKAKALKLREMWNRWHLNDMRPGCEHQRNWPAEKMLGMGNGKTKMAGWVLAPGCGTSKGAKEHPEGLLCKPCPVCGYRYGSEWLKEDVPEDALKWFVSLPDTKIKPAWI
jgi:hypothetical protein